MPRSSPKKIKAATNPLKTRRGCGNGDCGPIQTPSIHKRTERKLNHELVLGTLATAAGTGHGSGSFRIDRIGMTCPTPRTGFSDH